jgi:hypothetical protein
MEEEILCEWCKSQIKNDRDDYYIEVLDYHMCENCIDIYLNGPIEYDDLDDLMENLSLKTK